MPFVTRESLERFCPLVDRESVIKIRKDMAGNQSSSINFVSRTMQGRIDEQEKTCQELACRVFGRSGGSGGIFPIPFRVCELHPQPYQRPVNLRREKSFSRQCKKGLPALL